MFKGYGAKVGLGNMRVKAENRMVTSLIWNSPFRENIYDLSDASKGSVRAIDWQRGSPYVWQPDDFDELKNSSCLFARKFSAKYPDIIEHLFTFCSFSKQHM